MNKAMLLAVLGAGMILGAPAMADPPSSSSSSPSSCLMTSQIFNWKAPDNHTVIVEDNWHHKFKVSLMSTCWNLNFKERVGFQSLGGTALSCLGKGDYVIVRDVGMPQRCPITDIVPYTPAMEKADKAAAAAKAAQQNNP